MAPADVIELIPGARLVDGRVEIDVDLDAPFPTPYGTTPPVDWFTEPHHDVLPGASALITADGRFCAYSHEWDRCHVSFTDSGECWTPPRSVTGNRTFHQSRVQADAGAGQLVEIPVGVIPFGDGHAPLDATVAEAQQHYDRPERVTVWARAVETDDGCVMCGAIVPGTTNRQVALMRASALSGDWRWIPQLQSLDFIGPCFVARPGLPLGLEAAAIEQALWNIERASELNRAASGQITAVVGNIVAWSPRPAVTDNVPQSVIAAAMGDDRPMSTNQACSCSTGDEPSPAVTAPVVPSRRDRVTAAAGTGMTFRELDRAVDDALTAAFGDTDGLGVWSRDWDLESGAGWVVFELDRNDPITGDSTGTYQAGLAFVDGALVVDRSNVVEVDTVYQPVGGTVDEMPMVTAHASDTTAIAEIRQTLDTVAGTVEALAGDVARLSAMQLEPADVVDELPEAPEPV